ncbi:MAG TPA: hypothetical protein VM733_20130 [Thermoanaerobaculia bacterium]|nr:hypothetical protein [Thermoanaerobaculia bacterium]
MKILALAFLLFSTAAIEVQTGKLADEATQTFNAGSRAVAVYKSGNTTTVRVQEGDRVDTVTLSREGGKLSIGSKSNGASRRFIVVDRPKVVVDGIDLEPWLMDGAKVSADPGYFEVMPQERGVPMPKPDAGTNYFYCPKDGAKLVVPNDAAPNNTYRCPVDGTQMKGGVGPGRRYYLLAPHE